MSEWKPNDIAQGQTQVQLAAFRVAIVITIVFCLYFALFVASAKTSGQVGIELEYRINPNDASPASLARLPGIGLARAEAIAAYREQFRQSNRGNLAFQDCDDLQNVKGIGPVTAENMCVWLKFEQGQLPVFK
jgi:competence ComEA-like helix-hairpin-helix protein